LQFFTIFSVLFFLLPLQLLLLFLLLFLHHLLELLLFLQQLLFYYPLILSLRFISLVDLLHLIPALTAYEAVELIPKVLLLLLLLLDLLLEDVVETEGEPHLSLRVGFLIILKKSLVALLEIDVRLPLRIQNPIVLEVIDSSVGEVVQTIFEFLPAGHVLRRLRVHFLVVDVVVLLVEVLLLHFEHVGLDLVML
jgi:hypothetical protein